MISIKIVCVRKAEKIKMAASIMFVDKDTINKVFSRDDSAEGESSSNSESGEEEIE